MNIQFQNIWKQLNEDSTSVKKLFFGTSTKFNPPFRADNTYGEFEGLHFCYSFDECKAIAPQLYPKKRFLYSINYPLDIKNTLYMDGDLLNYDARNLAEYFLASNDLIDSNILNEAEISPCDIKFSQEEFKIFKKYFDEQSTNYESFHNIMKILKNHGYDAIEYKIIETGADKALMTDVTPQFDYKSFKFLGEIHYGK